MFVVLCINKEHKSVCVNQLCVCVFRYVLTSGGASLAAFASVSAGRIQQAHFRHLHSRSSFSYQLPGSLPQLPPTLCIPLLHTHKYKRKHEKHEKQWLLRRWTLQDAEKEWLKMETRVLTPSLTSNSRTFQVFIPSNSNTQRGIVWDTDQG